MKISKECKELIESLEERTNKLIEVEEALTPLADRILKIVEEIKGQE